MEQHILRDIFLSHKSTNKAFVRQLAADIESVMFQERYLMTWVDEAEIRPGQSVPGMVNNGLEMSRFIGLVMTPAYFRSESGWTDAEWHAALYVDPDNRKARILPILAADCPYIPMLLRHLNAIDLRGNEYRYGLKKLLAVLREEPLPRPVAYRGQLIEPSGKIDRASLMTERAVPHADADAVPERLYCNLLRVERLPQYVYMAPIKRALRIVKADGIEALPSKNRVKEIIRLEQAKGCVERPFMPAFRMSEDRIITFHDLSSPDGPLAPAIESEEAEEVPVHEFLGDEDDRRLLTSLLNMAVQRHLHRRGLTIDPMKSHRFFFPPKDGQAHIIEWRPWKKKAQRTVAKPCMKDGKIEFWRHQAAYVKLLFLPTRFYLQIIPTWVLTDDGFHVKGGRTVGRLIGRWTNPERNLAVLYHVRFWTSILRRGPGPISIRAGDQWMEISPSTAFIQQAYGVAQDYKDLMRSLDDEAPLIAQMEEEAADAIVAGDISEEMVALGEDENEIIEGDITEEDETEDA